MPVEHAIKMATFDFCHEDHDFGSSLCRRVLTVWSFV